MIISNVDLRLNEQQIVFSTILQGLTKDLLRLHFNHRGSYVLFTYFRIDQIFPNVPEVLNVQINEMRKKNFFFLQFWQRSLIQGGKKLNPMHKRI